MPTDQSDPSYLGATRGTNNTGELTAIAEALRYLLADQSSRPALIRYDSTYAANMAAGRWRAKSNKRLVASVRKLWTQAHEHLGGRLWASHVDAHTDHRWNDRADELARHARQRGRPSRTAAEGRLWVAPVGVCARAAGAT